MAATLYPLWSLTLLASASMISMAARRASGMYIMGRTVSSLRKQVYLPAWRAE